MTQAATETGQVQQTGRRLSKEHWYILAAAFLGWMFDGVEMGLFPIAARPALKDLLASTATSEAEIGQWISYLTAAFLLGAAAGGLLFGWLGDRVGRVRSMAMSIFAYSCFTGACYFAGGPWQESVLQILAARGWDLTPWSAEIAAGQLGTLRFLAALGMGGEWALGVALVMECWPEKLRPLLAGVIGAAGNVGYLLIALLALRFQVTPDSWRWTMLACASPAALAFVILLLIPESQRWKQATQRAGAKPIREIFLTRLLWPTLLATAFASVALIGTWAGVSGFLPSWADHLAGQDNPGAKAAVQMCVSIGAIIGCFVSPLIGGRYGRRPTYFGLCLCSLLVCGLLFRGMSEYGVLFLLVSGLAGCVTASFYGWLPLYLPELFPTRVRTTGQGLSYNFGRVFAAMGVLGQGQLMRLFEGSAMASGSVLGLVTWTSANTTYPRACATITLIYLLGMALIWLAPETKGKPLPE